jgi:hypothetical protein
VVPTVQGERNTALASHIAESGWVYDAVAMAVCRVAAENGQTLAVNKSAVAHWVAGRNAPQPATALFLAEALSRRLGRSVLLADVGLVDQTAVPESVDVWETDTLAALTDLGGIDASMRRRLFLGGAAAYTVAALVVPGADWWREMAERGAGRTALGARLVDLTDVQAVREMTAMFSKLDQHYGGGHGRMALVQYLTLEVPGFLRGCYADDAVRREMFTAASELAYVCGWMAFDNAEQRTAQQWFEIATKLAAEADDAPMAGHILRAMAHQAVDLGHYGPGLELAAASVEGNRYALASPRERALLGVVHARALANTGQRRAAAQALIRAEDDLAAAAHGDDEPPRVFFFSEASLAHETGRTLWDIGDLDGASTQLTRSVRKRQATTFTRTHAVTLGYLGALEAQGGNLEKACATWNQALDAMDGVRSGRTTKAAADMRLALSPFRRKGIAAVTKVDTRAAAYLMAVA